ncbi:MAG: hypothetical protein AB7O38_11405, partial [Pirellulaceae bacterium]
MYQPSTSAREREQRVDEAIVAWLAAVDRGAPPDRELFLTQHADVAEELRAFFRVHDRLAPWPTAATSDGPRSRTWPGQNAAGMRFPRGLELAPGAILATSGPGSAAFGDYELVDELARGGRGVV